MNRQYHVTRDSITGTIQSRNEISLPLAYAITDELWRSEEEREVEYFHYEGNTEIFYYFPDQKTGVGITTNDADIPITACLVIYK